MWQGGCSGSCYVSQGLFQIYICLLIIVDIGLVIGKQGYFLRINEEALRILNDIDIVININEKIQ